ncbi:MAG: D-alanyl-D-alanine carboxypeptidase [Ruminococcus sp.]|nr:D-alanyl-D-alanine carboxypeptidase [Ruminococcus sp.]
MRFLSFVLGSVLLLSGFQISAQAVDLPEISAKGAVVIDADTEEVLFSESKDERLPMASTTKIMSVLLVLEHGELDEEFVVDSEAIKTEGSSMGLQEGDIVTLRELCCGMLLPSGNDAANAAAVRVAGSVENFVGRMNDKAHELGLKDTHFVTPSGLDDNTDEHYSTAYDMARLAAEAIKDPDFCKICSSPSMPVEFGAPPYRRVLYNTNKLLGSCDGVFGVKTGFTDKAGRCLVSACKRDGKTLICVTLNDRNDWEDHKALYDRCYSYYSRQLLPKSSITFEISVVGGNADIVNCTSETVFAVMLRDKAQKCDVNVYIQPFVYAPVNNGDKVGQIVYSYNGFEIARADITADSSVNKYESSKKNDTSLIDVFMDIIDFII